MFHRALLLAIDTLGLEAWQMHDGTLLRVAGFGPGEAAALQDWLARRARREPCRILVNLADEAYEIEDLPRVRGADRKALITRRMAAWFPPPGFARAWSLGPAPDGRTGLERILFAGLERTDELRPWLDAVRASGTRITRLIPAANLIPAALATLQGKSAATAGPQLVAGFGRAGLRITLVADGLVHFSRLVARCTLADAAQSPAWLEEIERTRDYLQAQHRLPGDKPVTVRVLEPADARLLRPEPAVGADGAGGALAFVPLPLPAIPGSDDDTAPAQSGFDRLLARALQEAPAGLGWPPAPTPGNRLSLDARTLALASLVASTVIAGGAWYAENAALAAAAVDARRPPAVEPEPPPPPPLEPEFAPLPLIEAAAAPGVRPPGELAPAPPCPTPDMQAPALAPPPPPRRIEGIVLRPDGEALVWIDGAMRAARELGLQAANGGEPALSPTRARNQRLYVGDHWPASAQSMARPPARTPAAGATGALAPFPPDVDTEVLP